MPLSVEVSIAAVAPKGAAIGIGVPTSKNGLDLPASVAVSASTLAARGFEGKLGQTAVIPGKSSTQILVGLGASASLSSEAFRMVGAALARASFGETAMATAVIDQAPTKLDRAAVAAAFTEGVLLASYQFNTYKTKPTPRALASVVITGRGGRIASNGMTRGSLVAEAVALNRDLVNEPPRSLKKSWRNVPSKLLPLETSNARCGMNMISNVNVAAACLECLLEAMSLHD
jgi:leucyl aminopeptidase